MISVVVPVYNTENYLVRCIESVLNQTYKDIEILLIDDGSTDSSSKICDAYERRDSRVIVTHMLNKGLSGARNAGLEKAAGDLIAFVDSDDYVDEKMLEDMYDAFSRYKPDVVCCDSYYINTASSERVNSSSYNALYSGASIVQMIENMLNNGSRKDHFSTFCCTKLFVVETIRKYNIRFVESIKTAHETPFTLSYFTHIDKVYCTNKPYYHYFQHQSAATKKTKDISVLWGQLSEYLQVIDQIVADSRYAQRLGESFSGEFLKCMGKSIDREAKKIGVSYRQKRRNVMQALKIDSYRKRLKAVNIAKLSFRNKVYYITQTLGLVDIVLLKEISKEFIKKMLYK